MIPKKVILFFLLVMCIFACGKAEDPLEPERKEPMMLEFGTVAGTIFDAGTGQPIPGSTVTLLGNSVETGIDGSYTFLSIPYGDTYALDVVDVDYKSYNQPFVLKRQRLTLDIPLTPLRDPEQEILEFFDRFGSLIESVDVNNIQAIREHFSEAYVPANDDATLFGVASGFVPESYEDIDPAMLHLFDEYVFLEFLFKDVEMNITHARKASVVLRLDINAKKGPEEDLRENKAHCKFEFRREGSDWKIVYWQLFEIDVRL